MFHFSSLEHLEAFDMLEDSDKDMTSYNTVSSVLQQKIRFKSLDFFFWN